MVALLNPPSEDLADPFTNKLKFKPRSLPNRKNAVPVEFVF
jgi:hypothetical protein